uniref:Putative ribonuclease H-like domain-containing protein n=1 Tax=Tanacetum cinerariifolium TaxID=118510 RepID=A0A6L2LD12_TANCI|nr:putative ribonuclease H-like domain-containing protein [Tanacetum cinerariifolium]
MMNQQKEAIKQSDDVKKEFQAQCNSQLLQEKVVRSSSTKSITIVSTPVNTASASRTFIPPYDPLIPKLEDTIEIQTTSIFGNVYDEDDLETNNHSYADKSVGAEADFNNMEPSPVVSPIPTTIVHSNHPKSYIIGDLMSAVQTRGTIKKSSGEHAIISYIQKKNMTNHKDFQNCLFDCFLSQHEPTEITQALNDESWVEAMQEELLSFKIQKIWTLVDLPYGKKAIEKALYGLHQAPRARYETLFTYLLYNGFHRGQIDKTLFIKRLKGDILLVQENLLSSWVYKSAKENMESSLIRTKEVGILQAGAQPIPIPTEPSTSKPQKKHKPKRKHTKEPEVPPTKSQAEHNSEVIDIKSTCKAKIVKLEHSVERLEEENRVSKELKGVHSIVDSDEPLMEKDESSKQERKVAVIDADVEINLEKVQATTYNFDLDHQEKVLSMLDVNDEEPAGVEEIVEVVTAAKLITEVVTTARVDVNAASVQDTPITVVEATKVIVEVPKARKRRSVIIQDPEETTTTVTMQQKVQEKDKGKAILIEEPKPLTRQVQIDLDEENMAGYKMNYFKGMSLDEIRSLFEKHYNYNQAFINEVNEGIKVPEKEIVPDDDDDVYADATPLASKIPIVDYKIHTERNKPYFKIIRADGNHRFEKTEPKNYTDDYLLNTLKIMFEKPNVEANVWKEQKGKHGLAKVKSWKLFDSCGVHCLNLLTTQMFLLVEKMYPLIHFTLEQMVNDVRLEVDYESEMSLELLRLVRR